VARFLPSQLGGRKIHPTSMVYWHESLMEKHGFQMVPMSSVSWNSPFMGLQIYDVLWVLQGIPPLSDSQRLLSRCRKLSVDWLDCSFDRDSHNSWSKSKGDQSENARSLYLYDFNFYWLCVTIN
jgi:hypothetical protein